MESFNKLYLTSDETVLMDFNYRYVISPLEITYMNKKGTKITLLTNFDKFCEELHYDSNILLKIIGKKMSCKSGVDKTTKVPYLQGDFTEKNVKDIVYNFIQSYLLCSSCDKPEVVIKKKEKGVRQKCKACGHRCYLDSDDSIERYL